MTPTFDPAAGVVSVAGLTKHFGAVTAVDDLSFSVAPGRVTGFLGPNGAGKTTTLRMILGLATPDAGTVTIGGIGYADRPRPAVDAVRPRLADRSAVDLHDQPLRTVRPEAGDGPPPVR